MKTFFARWIENCLTAAAVVVGAAVIISILALIVWLDGKFQGWSGIVFMLTFLVLLGGFIMALIQRGEE